MRNTIITCCTIGVVFLTLSLIKFNKTSTPVNPVMQVRQITSGFGKYEIGNTYFTGTAFSFEVWCEQPKDIALVGRWTVPLGGSNNAKDALNFAIKETLMEALHRTPATRYAWTTADGAEWIHLPQTNNLLETVACGTPTLTGVISINL